MTALESAFRGHEMMMNPTNVKSFSTSSRLSSRTCTHHSAHMHHALGLCSPLHSSQCTHTPHTWPVQSTALITVHTRTTHLACAVYCTHHSAHIHHTWPGQSTALITVHTCTTHLACAVYCTHHSAHMHHALGLCSLLHSSQCTHTPHTWPVQ